MLSRVRNWPWLTLQIIAANVVIILVLAVIWSWAFMQQSDAYSERLMTTFNIEPGLVHAMYVDDVERQLRLSVSMGLILAVVAALGVALLIARPLRDMARTAERLQFGDYSVRTPTGTGEVGRLSETLNALAETLEQEDRRRTQYLADLSHELRTPITSLRGYIEGLEDGVFQADKAFFERMTSELAHLTSLTHTIDTMSLATEGAAAASEQVPLPEALAQAITPWEERLAERGLTLDLSIATRLEATTLKMSRPHQKLIFDNLLSNMYRYAPAGSVCRIAVAQSPRKGFGSLVFENRAPDITDRDMPFLFDRFYRVSNSRTRLGDDHPKGLGLAIVKQLCVSSDGRVAARRDGDRLRIELELPVGVRGKIEPREAARAE
ncbi:MAG: histidine kinase dimerization/phospho-acceptor domain-containing protein [Pseudomonadota bacterium]